MYFAFKQIWKNLLQNHIKEKTQIRIHSKTFLICQTVDKTDCVRRNKTKLQLQYSSHKIRKTNPNSCIKYQSFHASILPLHASWRKKSSRKWPATLILKKRTKSVRHFQAQIDRTFRQVDRTYRHVNNALIKIDMTLGQVDMTSRQVNRTFRQEDKTLILLAGRHDTYTGRQDVRTG